MKAKRKTILPNDLFQALSDMELEEFVPELKESLEGLCLFLSDWSYWLKCEKCLSVYKKDQKDKKQAAANRKLQKAAIEDKEPETTAQIVPMEKEEEEAVDMECSTSEVAPNAVMDSQPLPSTMTPPAVSTNNELIATDSLPDVLNS